MLNTTKNPANTIKSDKLTLVIDSALATPKNSANAKHTKAIADAALNSKYFDSLKKVFIPYDSHLLLIILSLLRRS
jgi:hypothetical protein